MQEEEDSVVVEVEVVDVAVDEVVLEIVGDSVVAVVEVVEGDVGAPRGGGRGRGGMPAFQGKKTTF